MSNSDTPRWVFIGFAAECDLCGGTEDVHRYEHTETDEQKAMCNPCEQAT